MATWTEFAEQAPELAAFGRQRFARSEVGYLATVRGDGGPRVHPVTPVFGEQLYLFMEPNSPKGRDLQREPRFSLHCSVEDNSGGQGEFYLRGTARLSADGEERQRASEAASYQPAERYILFVLDLDFAYMKQYTDDGASSRRWRAQSP